MLNHDFLSTAEASAISGISAPKLRRLIELGRLPAKDTSTGERPRWTIRRCDLEAFLEPDNVRPESPPPVPTRRRRLDADVPQVF